MVTTGGILHDQGGETWFSTALKAQNPYFISTLLVNLKVLKRLNHCRILINLIERMVMMRRRRRLLLLLKH